MSADPCPHCGALPCDWASGSPAELPRVVTLFESGGSRFIIDSRDDENRDMFSGFRLSVHGRIGATRLNFHRSHFIDELPA